MNRAYCTYFDSHYLAQGIAMLRSLWRYDPSAVVHVLALDDTCARILDDVFARAVCVTRLEAFHASFPSLPALVDKRTRWAFYATHKPAFARFILETLPPNSSVTYIDSDTWFLGKPEPLYNEIAGASIGLSPHRFSAATAHLAVYGTYNAGCIYWRADETGRQCIAEWESDCLEWCDESLSGDGRFMNQGYLNRWPDRYPEVHIIRHPGVNLAPWNLDGHRLERDATGVTVDGLPLIFYHFSGLLRDAENQWYFCFYPHSSAQFEFARNALYGPYLLAVETERRMLVETYGLEGVGSVRSIPIGPEAVRLYPGGPK